MKQLITKTLLLLILTTNAFAMTSKENTTKPNASFEANKTSSEAITGKEEGRDFSTLSFNADGSELMFNECFYYPDEANQKKKYPEGECRIFRLNLTNNTLRHYDLPDKDKYTYTDGSFSPSGNYIVMKRAPKNKYDKKLSDKENAELAQRNYEQSEIAVMKADGTNFKVIKMEPGLKARPVMSNDETKIAYVRSKARPQGSKTYSSHFDVYEIDLKHKTDKLFAGPHQFFETGQMQYLKGDKEILMHAHGPRKHIKELSDYMRRYNNSSIYTVKRGEEEVPEPMVVEGVENQSDPFLTKNGTMFFYGSGSKAGPFTLGISLFRKTTNGKVTQWIRNVKDGLGYAQNEQSITSNPQETKIFLIYTFSSGSEWVRPDLTKNGIAFFEVKSSQWFKLPIPAITSSKPIPIKGSETIETRFTNSSLKKIPTFSLTNPITPKH